MPTFVTQTIVHASVETVFGFHEREDALQLLSPPFVRIIRKQGGIEPGARVELEVGPFRWIALHTALEKTRYFEDRQISGPFSRWIHRHEFEGVGRSTRLSERIDYELPGGVWAERLFGGAMRLALCLMFRHRHRITKLWCERAESV